MTLRSSVLLRRAFVADAVVTATVAAAFLAAAGPLGALFGVPAALLRWVGLILMPFATLVGYLATRDDVSRTGVQAIVAVNALWAVDSVVLLFTGWIEPTLLGVVFIAGQALIVAAFAELQYVGMRQSPAAP